VLRSVSNRLRHLGQRRRIHIGCVHTCLGDGFAATARQGIVTVYKTTGC
jgi:hypothetical protein